MFAHEFQLSSSLPLQLEWLLNVSGCAWTWTCHGFASKEAGRAQKQQSAVGLELGFEQAVRVYIEFTSVDEPVVLHLKSRSVTSFLFGVEKNSMAPAHSFVAAWPSCQG